MRHIHIRRWLASLWRGRTRSLFRFSPTRSLALWYYRSYSSEFPLPSFFRSLFLSLFLSSFSPSLVPFLSFSFFPSFFFGSIHFHSGSFCQLRATVSCYSCGEGGVWLTSLSVIFVSIDSGSSKPFWVLA